MQKDRNISLRLTSEDYDTVNKNAESLNMSQSEYIRAVGTSALCRLVVKLTYKKRR